MDHLQLGDRGSRVRDLQERLEELGFDTPGVFGPATEAAVIAFQKSRGLLPDGIVGPITRAALAAAMPPVPGANEEPPLEVDRTLRLPAGQFLAEAFPKHLLVLHHTAGGSAASTFDWWATGQPERIATAYLVARDGIIHEVFEPRFWAFHLGLAGTGGRVDRRSIGIEIASEGPLTPEGDGFTAFGRPFTRQVFDHGEPWRGHRFFAAYTEPQLASVVALVDHLLTTFPIPRRTPADHLSHDQDLWTFQGVVGHHHLRPDKTDLHPGFDWRRLIDGAGLEEV